MDGEPNMTQSHERNLGTAKLAIVFAHNCADERHWTADYTSTQLSIITSPIL